MDYAKLCKEENCAINQLRVLHRSNLSGVATRAIFLRRRPILKKFGPIQTNISDF
jgi:hypothetical protein